MLAQPDTEVREPEHISEDQVSGSDTDLGTDRAHWAELTPFLSFSPEVRRVIYTTNLIESMNALLRKVTPQPRPVPLRAGRAESALHGSPEPRGDPRP